MEILKSHSNLSLPPSLVLVSMTQCDELLQFDWRTNIAFNKLLSEREREIPSKLADGKRHPDLTQSHTLSLIWSTLEPSEGRLFVQLLIKWRCSYLALAPSERIGCSSRIITAVLDKVALSSVLGSWLRTNSFWLYPSPFVHVSVLYLSILFFILTLLIFGCRCLSLLLLTSKITCSCLLCSKAFFVICRCVNWYNWWLVALNVNYAALLLNSKLSHISEGYFSSSTRSIWSLQRVYCCKKNKKWIEQFMCWKRFSCQTKLNVLHATEALGHCAIKWLRLMRDETLGSGEMGLLSKFCTLAEAAADFINCNWLIAFAARSAHF